MTQTPAGWYADPDPSSAGTGRIRYWDGQQWTANVQDPPPVAPVQPSGLPTYPTYPGTPDQQPAYGAPYGQYPPQQHPGYQPFPTTPDGQRLAGWWQRVLAVVIDFFVQLPLLLLAAVPVVASQWDELSAWGDDLVDAAENGTADPPLPELFDLTTGPGITFIVSMVAATVLYNLVFLRWKQATPGKLILGLRVRRRDVAGTLPWETIVVRVAFVSALSLFSNIPLLGLLFTVAVLLDSLWPLWDSKKQALHDKVARTNVVRVH